MTVTRRADSLDSLFQRMDEWPASWAGFPEDVPVGHRLVAILRPFLARLHAQGLGAKTLRAHLNNLWVIGGEVIRKVTNDPARRRRAAHDLLREAVMGGEAPLVGGLTETEQRALDATARKLDRFLSSGDETTIE